MLNKLFLHPLSRLLVILVLGTLAYANSFEVPFSLDDEDSITRNPVIQEISNFIPGGSGYESNPNRWVGYFTFALNYHFGGFDVTGYHIFNLAVHLSTALLVYALVVLTFRSPSLAGSRLAPQAGTAALLAALFFMVHPVQTQAVTYVVQRLTSLAALFYLLAIVFYATARLKLEGLQRRGPGKIFRISQGDWQVPLLFSGAVVAAILAMKSKEIAFTLPFAAALYEVCFFRGAWKQRLLFLLPLLLTLPIVPLGVLAGGNESAGESLSDVNEQLRAQTDIPRLHYLFTQFRVIATYLRLLVLPINQNLDYDYPVFTTFLTPPVFLSFLLLAGFFGLAVYLHRRSGHPQASASNPQSLTRDPALRLVSFGIFWFFLALSVESSLIPITDVIFEHRLYLPSVGLATAFAILILLAAQRSSAVFSGRIPLVAASLILIGLTVATWQRNQVWGSNISLWEDVVRKSPGKARPWYNLGTYLTDAGRPTEAIPALSRAVKIDPQHAEAWHNLGRALLLSGRTAEAVGPLRTAVRLKPEMDNAVVNFSVALINTGNHLEAVEHLERMRRRYPDWPEVRLNLGIAYVGAGNLLAARGELAALFRLSPQLAPILADQISRADTAR